MPSPSDCERLAHIIEAIALIEEFVSDLDYDGFSTDRKTQLSGERLLEIIGEAANHVSPEVQTRYPAIPWRAVSDLRNVLSHEYFRLRQELIWEVIVKELPVLKRQIAQVIADLDC